MKRTAAWRMALPARTRLCYPAAWAALGISVPITLALGGSLRPGDARILPGMVHLTAARLASGRHMRLLPQAGNPEPEQGNPAGHGKPALSDVS